MSEETEETHKIPGLYRNYISLIGAAIVLACLASILLLILIEMTGANDNPYLGILTYIILPGGLIFGLAIFFAGML